MLNGERTCAQRSRLLSLQYQIWWTAALYCEIVNTFWPIRGEPPEGPTKMRRYIVAISVKRGSRMVRSLLDMAMLPTGDWANSTRTECYIPVDMVYEHNELADTFARRLTRCLAPKLYKVMSKDLHSLHTGSLCFGCCESTQICTSSECLNVYVIACCLD